MESGYMFSKVPIDLSNIKKENIDKEILRAALMAELDAINLYEQMAGMTDNKEVSDVLLDVAKEEKRTREFQTLLLQIDQQQVDELEAGKKEVEEELGK
jgi:rubrerythrin